MRRVLGLATAAALVVGSTTAFAQQPQPATAELRNASGQVVGTATFMPMGDGVQIVAQLRNLPPGLHGIHLHAVGRCDPPDFTSAGGHFNPTGTEHGLEDPDGPHAGDLPNLVVAADGTATFEYLNPRVTLGPGEASLFDADGTALVVHADPDDQVTDPAGNSGARIACGVLSRAGAPAVQATPAAKPAGTPAAAPAQAPRQSASPMPAGLPRTGTAAGVAGVAVPAALAGLAALGLGFRLRRRR